VSLQSLIEPTSFCLAILANLQVCNLPARQGSKLAGKGAYIDVSDRSLQVQLTKQAKISPFSSFGEIFAFAGFVSSLGPAKPDWQTQRVCLLAFGNPFP